MKIIPVMTEKSLAQAQEGKYTFLFQPDFTKDKIKDVINKTFKVHVTKIQTVQYKARTKKNIQRKKLGVKGYKKAIVVLKGKEKIDLFTAEKKK